MGPPSNWCGSAASGSTSSSLLERVKAQDPEAWQRLVELYGPLIYQWVRHCGLQAEDAADVGQEVLAAVARRVATFRRDRPGDTFRGWLWTITQNKARDHFRRLHGQAQAQGGTTAQDRLAQVPDDDPIGPSAAGSAAAENPLHRKAMEIVRGQVEERTWQAFWLVAAEDRDPADVAQHLGMTLQQVYDAKYRVRRRMRRELDDLLD
jgi:RNA polymerase sigma-70 factor (ECF subfamily)